MHALRATRLVLVLLALSSTLQAQDIPLATRLERVAGLTAESSSAFFAALRRNVWRDDRKATCAMVAYPLAQASDLHITAINSQTAGLQPPKGKVLLACFVAGQRIRVSADGLGSALLSVWRTMRPDGAPDLEFPHPEPPGPPTQCGSRSWTFTDGTRTYVVAELPCDAYLSPPPMGSVGRVTLSTPASTDAVPLWCSE